MIAKLSTGNGFGGATSYLLRNGESDKERAKVKVLAASGVDFTIDKNGNIVLDARQVARDFRFQAMMMPSVRKPVYDIALSWKVGEHVPSHEKLARTEEFLQMIGFGNTQYVIVEHKKENEHSHAIANIVDNDGNRISTKDLIDRMHAAAREITKKYGYQWGDAAKKETIKKAHKPHEKARYTIEPKVKGAVARANNIKELPSLLKPSGIGCNIKYSEAGKPVGISFSVEFEGQLHTFKGSDLDRSLSAGNIVKNIDSRLAQHQEAVTKYKDMVASYNSIIPPMFSPDKVSLISVRNKAFQLMKDVDETKIALNTETKSKFSELKNTWNEFSRLEQERKSVKNYTGVTKAIGGMLMLLNPLMGLTVMFLAKVANDIRQSEIKAQKKQLLAMVVSIRSEIYQLQNEKAQLKIEKQERLQEYLEAKQMLKEYNEGLETVDQTVHDTHIDMLKEEFPFKEPGHIMYIVHSQTNASIFHAGEDAKVFRAKRIKGGTFDDDRIEAARCMLKDRGYMVAGDRGPDGHDGFYERLLEEQKYEDFRIGNMYIQSDGKVIFGEEVIFGNPENTAPALKHEPEPAVNPKDENVSIYNDGRSNFRIKKEEDGTYKLLHQDWDNKSFVNGKATKKKWYIKKKFTSFSEIGRDKNYLYLKIQDLSGKTMYINQYGNNLTDKQLKSLGIKTNGRTM